jgi:hypothetical protein
MLSLMEVDSLGVTSVLFRSLSLVLMLTLTDSLVLELCESLVEALTL